MLAFTCGLIGTIPQQKKYVIEEIRKMQQQYLKAPAMVSCFIWYPSNRGGSSKIMAVLSPYAYFSIYTLATQLYLNRSRKVTSQISSLTWPEASTFVTQGKYEPLHTWDPRYNSDPMSPERWLCSLMFSDYPKLSHLLLLLPILFLPFTKHKLQLHNKLSQASVQD